MINLLPLSDKEMQHKERRARVVTTFFALFIVVEIISLVLLFAPFLLASAKEKLVEQKLALLEQKIAREGGESYADIVKNTNERLTFFFNVDERSRDDSAYMYQIMQTIPSGVSVTDFSFKELQVQDTTKDKDKDKEEKVEERSPLGREVYIGGVASTRTALLAFVDALKAQSAISDVVLPVSNFTQSSDIDFSITLTIQ